MVQKSSSRNKPSKPNPKQNTGKDSLWNQHGLEDVYIQREAQVNLWTVLGGIAAAALLTQISNLAAEIQAGRWYLILYGLTAILLIASSWVQNLWGSILLKMQVNYIYVLLWLMNMFSLSIMCLYVTKPAVFLAACATILLTTLLFQIYLMKSGAWDIFTPQMVKDIKITLWSYCVIMVLCCCAVIQLTLYPSITGEIGWGVFATFTSTGAVIMHNFGMKKERQHFNIP